MTTILIVDDSPTILMSMSSILGRAGYKVEQADSGETAARKLQGGMSANLIITDYNMPGMNGAELIRTARKIAPLRFVPMLVLTTESQQSKRDEAKAAGATGWLVKPVDPAQLLGVIKQLVPGA
jgi:two-component system, chemotaxis family, chemotaxis protein CheY